MLHHHHHHHYQPFQESFWSPTASIESVPNFSIGFQVLHKKLDQSKKENSMILDYVKARIEAEKHHAATLLAIPKPEPQQDEEPSSMIETGLKKCFDSVRFESEASAKEHQLRSENLLTTVLDPLLNFFQRYDRIRLQTKERVESSISDFHTAVKLMDQFKSTYVTKCKAVLILEPEFDVQAVTLIHVGSHRFTTRDQLIQWFQSLAPNNQTKQEWMHVLQEEADALDDLVQLGLLRQEQDEFIKTLEQVKKGFFSTVRWNSQQRKDDLIKEMLDADRLYKQSVKKVEKLRTHIEELLVNHYEEMESLELERIQTIKQAFIGIAASLSNTIPRCKETYDHMMLYQETLKPDKEVQSIVEQYRTGQFLPKPILYQNYFYGASKDQLFGVPLEEITKIQGSLVPTLISEGLSVIESGISQLCEEERNVVWIKNLPLETIHKAREELNSSMEITKEKLEKYDLLLLANVIRLYLLELPECLFTFEFYDPCKIIYANHESESRLVSLSKLLATLPTSNYHTIMTLFGHFHHLIHNSNSQMTVSKSFSYILSRPQIETKLSLHERHPQKLLQDLIEHYNVLFTHDLIQLQEKNSSRRPLTVESSARSSRSSSSLIRSHSTPTSSSCSSSLRMPSSSTLFEDPDESPMMIKQQQQWEEVTSLDAFFEDDED